MLCGLGSTILATTAATKWDAAALAAGYAASTAFTFTSTLPDAAWTGVAVAFVAALRIFRPRVPLLAPACGGVLAGITSALLQAQGLPAPLALSLSAAVLAMSALLTAKLPAFAPEALREEALLVAVGLGLAVATLPEISAGWHSALVLNREEQHSANHVIANWVFVLSAASVALGSLYSLLRRR